MTPSVWRRALDVAPDAAAIAAVLLLGLAELVRLTAVESGRGGLVAVVLATATAVGLSRRAPAAAVALAWVMGLLQVVTDTPVLFVQLSLAVVAFGAARWGSSAVVLLSGLSVPAVAVLGVALLQSGLFRLLSLSLGSDSLLRGASQLAPSLQLGGLVLGTSVLGAPWLAGLALRFGSRVQQSRLSQAAAEQDAARALQESEQAREIAQLREEQTRLARDVHDVVGHSLAVILAQAESAQYVADAETDRLKQTMANIATSARTSLQDVRQVLVNTQGSTSPGPSGGLDGLLEGVASSGRDVVSTVAGSPRPLPPELEAVAYRVLQEMLTNALKHGRRDTPVTVERRWEDELRLEVRNAMAGQETPEATLPLPAGQAGPADGQGVDGMRRRLQAVGGRLDVRRRDEQDGPTFIATAWLPVRSGA